MIEWWLKVKAKLLHLGLGLGSRPGKHFREAKFEMFNTKQMLFRLAKIERKNDKANEKNNKETKTTGK